MNGESVYWDTRAVFDYGKRAIREGRSLGEIEIDLRTQGGVDEYLVERTLPLIVAYANATKLGRMSYRSWIKGMSNDLYAGGSAGVWLAAIMIPVCLVASMWPVLAMGLTDDSAKFLAPLFAMLCFPAAWVGGWPIFHASRLYWRWRLRRLDAVEDLDALDTSRLPRAVYFS